MGSGNSQELGKIYDYSEVLGTSGHKKKNPYGDSETIDYIIEFCRRKYDDCWGSNALHHGSGGNDSPLYVKAINLGKTDMYDKDAGNLFYVLRDFNFSMDIINLSNNKLGNLGVESMIYGITCLQYQTLYNAESGWKAYQGSLKTAQSVVNINLSNNQIGNGGAKLLADAIACGSLPSTKSIDVSANQITSTGYGYLINSLKSSKVTDIIIKHYNLSFLGNKETKIGFMRDYLNQAEANGIDTKNIVVDKNISTVLKNTGKLSISISYGFAKCFFVDEAIEGYIAEKIVAKVFKSLSKLVNADAVISCYAEAFDEAMTSPEGVQFIKTDLELMGVDTFVNGME